MPAPVTSYSSQVLAVMAPLSSRFAVVRAGRLLQVIPVSVQPVPVPNTAGPSALALLAALVVCSRSFTLVTAPDTPLTSNFRLLSTSGSVPPSASSVVAVPKLLAGFASSTRASAAAENVRELEAAGRYVAVYVLEVVPAMTSWLCAPLSDHDANS